jgi:uncharacterized cupin superfamily protein
MEAVYNDGTKDVSRPVVCTSDGKLIISAGSSSSPLPTTDTLGGTREHALATMTRQAVGSTSARVALPTLGTSRELYVMANTRCYFMTGNSSVTAAAGTSHPLATDERFYFRVPAGHTHIAYIRDSADGFISVVPVA